MGIGPAAIKLTRLIHTANILPHNFSVLELGSQDFAPDYETAHRALREEFGFTDPSAILRPEQLYSRLGSNRYESIDLNGQNDAHRFDLNFNLSEKYGFTGQYDLVTNHGTTEHLFNQAIAFENIHKLTAPGGVMVHMLPFQGYQN